jgi:3-hydroxybutyryl-CoA dehydrogenase
MNIHSIVVCGSGTMGSGIAQVFAHHGFATIQFDVNEEMLHKSKAAIEKNLQVLIEKGKLKEAEKTTILQRLFFTSDIYQCKADLIIEAIIEKKEAKISLFNKLTEINATETIFASNTSSISIKSIAKEIIHPQRFLGMHFFNPAPVMKLVEVIKANDTTDEVIETIISVCKQLNKTAVVCKDAPGFIVNRVARPYYLEAMKLVEQGAATIETVDAIMLTTGFKMGPFKLMDLIGLDINYSVSEIVWTDLGKPERLKPSIIQQQKIEANELGKKTGKGFYEY